MTHRERIVEWFRARHGHATLREILESHEPFAYEIRARFTELRKEGYVITCERGTTPSENKYVVVPPEENGQMRLAS